MQPKYRLTLLMLLMPSLFAGFAWASDKEAIVATVMSLTPQDVVIIEKHAQSGDVKAQTVLGMTYALGKATSQNYIEAAKWYRKAAEQGFTVAQYELGVAYDNGKGLKKNYTEAVKWYRKAAEQGFVEAQTNLGYAYEQGQGVKKNYAESIKWYQKAAEKGSLDAQFNLGLIYATGKGVQTDIVMAYMWFSLVASDGDPQAMRNVAQLKQRMSAEQITQARNKITEWQQKNPKPVAPPLQPEESGPMISL
jgi:uncharacterized protein